MRELGSLIYTFKISGSGIFFKKRETALCGLREMPGSLEGGMTGASAGVRLHAQAAALKNQLVGKRFYSKD